MKSRLSLALVLAIILVAAFPLYRNISPAVEAAEIKNLLEGAASRLEIPQPGQIVLYTSHYYHRMPPKELEPDDPYHLSYKQIWSPDETVKSWIQIDNEGRNVRWRTQLFNAEGLLTQDLFFENGVETDYFPLEDKAYRFGGETTLFRDNRQALIEDFLGDEQLERRENVNLDGRSVISIYSEPLTVASDSSWVSKSIDEALLTYQRPFVTDLKPVLRGVRIDFDPDTFLPIGSGEVVWNEENVEHIISYQTFVGQEILSIEEGDAVFQQEVPEYAFQEETANLPGDEVFITSLSEIIQHIDYSLYLLPDSPDFPRMTSIALVNSEPIMNQFFSLANQPGLGMSIPGSVNVQYRERQNDGILVINQGVKEEMMAVLKQTPPNWTQANQRQLLLGSNNIVAWELTGPNEERTNYIIEVGRNLILIEGNQVAPERIVDLIRFLKLTKYD